MFKNRILPILILVSGLVMTLVASYSVYEDNKKIDFQGFETECRGFESEIRIHLKANSQILYNSSSFISSSDTITRSEWNQFQTLNKSRSEADGIQAIGYSEVVSREHLPEFEKQISAEEFPGFKVTPEVTGMYCAPIIYLEPLSAENRKAVGFDLFAGPVRRKAMVLSRDSNMAVVSDKIYLVQDSVVGEQAAALMFVPVFRANKPTATLGDREKACMGWVFCAFRMNDFISRLSTGWDYKANRIKIFDGPDLSDEALLYDSDRDYVVERTDPEVYQFSIPMKFNGKLWTLSFSKYSGVLISAQKRIAPVVLTGTMITLIVFLLAISLMNTKAKSQHIQKLNDDLNKVNESKNRFISVLAHDLKNPFNTLLGFSELLANNLNELKKEEIEVYVNQINKTSHITYQLLEELLLWARVQSDQFPFNPGKLDICELSRIVVRDFELTAASKQIAISCVCEAGLFVHADGLMVKTILRNLLGNAVKFTNSGGSVAVRTAISGQEVVVTVEDNGIGMSQAQLAKLFDLNNKESREGTAGERGTGLGLLLCRDMVEKHQGKVWAESEPGVGSRFMFTLPASLV